MLARFATSCFRHRFELKVKPVSAIQLQEEERKKQKRSYVSLVTSYSLDDSSSNESYRHCLHQMFTSADVQPIVPQFRYVMVRDYLYTYVL